MLIFGNYCSTTANYKPILNNMLTYRLINLYLSAILLFFSFNLSAQSIVVNEILSSNSQTIADEDGDYEDWIELYNFGDELVSLAGIGLSDNYNNPFKWVFPDISIEPDQFMIVFASGKDRKFYSGQYNTSWHSVFQPVTGVWNFDETAGDTAYDASENANHALIQGAVRIPWEGFGGALEFNPDNNDRVTIPNHESLQLNGSMTVSMWLKLNDYSGGQNPWEKSYRNEGAITVSNNGSLFYYWGIDTEFQGFNSGEILPLNEWTHIVLVRDLEMGLLKWYFNGKLIASTMASYPASGVSSNNMRIGRGYAGTFDGAIAKPLVLAYAATNEQVRDMYLTFRGNLHTNFSISAAGEEIILTRPDGIRIDEVPPTFLPTDISYGRKPDGTGSWYYFEEPSPGLPNNATAYTEILQQPILSHQGGFYTQGFPLSISHPDPEAAILYTLDGSAPNPAHLGTTTFQYKNVFPENPGDALGSFLTMPVASFLYDQPIPIDDPSPQPNTISMVAATYSQQWAHFPDIPINKAKVIRARAFKENALPGRIASGTFFVGPEGRNKYDLPVVSMMTDASNLFDYDAGIWSPGVDFDNWRIQNPDEAVDPGKPANYHRRGREWEYPMHFEYFETGQNHAVLSHGAGFRMHGEWGRAIQRKNTRVYARSAYGAATFNHQLFPGQNYDDYKVFLLRNSDWGSTNMRDQYLQYIARNIGFETQDYRPVILFVNGEYWGLGIQMERYDEHYINQKYGIEEDEFDQIKARTEVEHGDELHHNYTLEYLEANNLADPDHFAYFNTLVDVDNFTDYWITNIYFGNNDWPYKNIRKWRKRVPFTEGAGVHDGRWRWLMFDLDWCFDLLAGNVLYHNTSPQAEGSNRPDWSTAIIRALLENEEYKLHFITRFSDLLNTAFHPAVTTQALEMFRDWLAPFMPEHIERWKSMSSYDRWQTNVNGIQSYAQQWPDTMRIHLKARFGLDESIQAFVSVNNTGGGFIKLNTINIPDSSLQSGNYWSGYYFRGLPLKFEAIARPGFAFSHWEGLPDPNAAIQSISPQQNVQVKAHFEFVGTPELLHFWLFDTRLPNDTPLESIAATFSKLPNAMLHFESCLDGYPYTQGHPLWRKASMERRNAPTPINYLPEANGNIPYNQANMRGIQVKQPFVVEENENSLVFHLPTNGYSEPIMQFAAKDEGAATHLVVEYQTGNDQHDWTNEGLCNSSLPLGIDYELYTLDFTAIGETSENEHFKVRLRFDGPDMSADEGNRVTFNNISLHAVMIPGFAEAAAPVQVHLNSMPNPFSCSTTIEFEIYKKGHVSLQLFNSMGMLMETIVDEKLKAGSYQRHIIGNKLTQGAYVLRLRHGNEEVVRRMVKF